MTEISHDIPNPQRSFATGDFVVSAEVTSEGVDLAVNHNGLNDNGEIILDGASREEGLAVVNGLIEGLTKARDMILAEIPYTESS